MAGRAAPTAIDPSHAQENRPPRQVARKPRCAPAAWDRPGTAPCATGPAGRRRSLPDAEARGARVSLCPPRELLRCCAARRDGVLGYVTDPAYSALIPAALMVGHHFSMS